MHQRHTLTCQPFMCVLYKEVKILFDLRLISTSRCKCLFSLPNLSIRLYRKGLSFTHVLFHTYRTCRFTLYLNQKTRNETSQYVPYLLCIYLTLNQLSIATPYISLATPYISLATHRNASRCSRCEQLPFSMKLLSQI